MQLKIVKEVVLRLESARDSRNLAQFKEDLRQRFKLRSLVWGSS
jgi:hypothetical protein